MATTKIEWADMVWNPVVGCSKASEGCRNCYAERMARRLQAMGIHAYDGTVNKQGWTGQVNEVSEALEKPTRWKKPQMVFVNSMSDLFHPSVRVSYIANVWAVMGMEYRHTYLVLTKHADRMNAVLNSQEFRDEYNECMKILTERTLSGVDLPDNVWLGVSVENARHYDRIEHLLQTPAARRFVSIEPMLGPVELSGYFRCTDRCGEDELGLCSGEPQCSDFRPVGLDWVICGGESGPGARPMHPDWARQLRDQCQEAKVPFFFKSWGEWRPEFVGKNFEPTCAVCGCTEYDPCDGGCWWIDNAGEMCERCSSCSTVKGHEWPDGSYSFRVGKKKAGRLLDGREWNETPTPTLPHF